MINWIMAAMALAGTILNIKKQKYGFAFWIVSNGYWCIHNILIQEYAQAFLYFIFFLLAIWGLISWSKNQVCEDLE